MNLMLVVEIVVAVLLVGTFSMCLVLNRRLGNLRANQDEMRRLIADFDKALSKARVGMAELKAASASVDAAHEERMKQAKTLREELGFMIEAADRLADRLAGEAAGNRQFSSQRNEGRAETPAKSRAPDRTSDRTADRIADRAESVATPDAPTQRAAPARRPAEAAAPRFKIEARSEAERELLMALRQPR